jgi:hypothetical protein
VLRLSDATPTSCKLQPHSAVPLGGCLESGDGQGRASSSDSLDMGIIRCHLGEHGKNNNWSAAEESRNAWEAEKGDIEGQGALDLGWEPPRRDWGSVSTWLL